MVPLHADELTDKQAYLDDILDANGILDAEQLDQLEQLAQIGPCIYPFDGMETFEGYNPRRQ